MLDPEYAMMLESFMQTAKSCNQQLVDGAVMIFVPRGGETADSTVVSWMPDHVDKDAGLIWHDIFLTMLWTLMNAGVSGEILTDMVSYAVKHSGSISSSDLSAQFVEEEAN